MVFESKDHSPPRSIQILAKENNYGLILDFLARKLLSAENHESRKVGRESVWSELENVAQAAR